MSIEDFIKERVDGQISYFEKKSKCHKRWYYILAGISILGSIFAASVPSNGYWVSISKILSILVALSIGFESLFRLKDKWMLYRNTAEQLISEKSKFQIQRNVTEDMEKEFVNRIDEIISNSNNQWKDIASKSNNKS